MAHARCQHGNASCAVWPTSQKCLINIWTSAHAVTTAASFRIDIDSSEQGRGEEGSAWLLGFVVHPRQRAGHNAIAPQTGNSCSSICSGTPPVACSLTYLTPGCGAPGTFVSETSLTPRSSADEPSTATNCRQLVRFDACAAELTVISTVSDML